MGFEVEVKYRAVDHAGLAARLEGLGAATGPSVAQVDLYLTHPSRDFARTNEAFRLRRSGGRNLLTYKGPKRAGPTKTREEVEVAFESGDAPFEAMRRVFEALGFREVAAIRKARRPFHLVHRGRPIEVVLDLAEGLGAFAEVEALAASEAELPAVQADVLELAGELGLSEVEPRSYLRITLEAGRAGS